MNVSEKGLTMQLTSFRENITQTQESEGLIRVTFDYKVQSAQATVAWLGPKIPLQEWQQMLAFFKWTNTEHHSESQVRLFVNPKLNTWKIWAFPQEARTGMSAREISGSGFDEQRALFKDDEGWMYFGTVHHHCSAGAFQSGTDFANEKNQDGLHITVGHMDRDIHDLHCRFAISGSLFDPDMSWFWDIGEVIRGMTPINIHNLIARHQMSLTANVSFPDKWKENVIELRGGPAYAGGFFNPSKPWAEQDGYTGPTGITYYPRRTGPPQTSVGETYVGTSSGPVAAKGVGEVNHSPSSPTPVPRRIEARTMLLVHRAEKAVGDLNHMGYSDEEIITAINAGSVEPALFNAIMQVTAEWGVEIEDIERECNWSYGRKQYQKETEAAIAKIKEAAATGGDSQVMGSEWDGYAYTGD